MEALPLWVVPAVATVTVLLLALVLRTKISNRKRYRLPPGPRGWPIIGNFASVTGSKPHESLYELSKQYGPIMLMHLGSVRTMIISSAELAEEIYKTNDQIMASRPSLIAPKSLCPAGDLVFAPYGQQWRYLRKICTIGLLTAARINQFREARQREVMANLHFILDESKRGMAVDLADCLATLTTNNITQMIMNKDIYARRSRSKSGILADCTPIQVAFHEIFTLLGTANIADFLPFLKPFDPQGLNKQLKDVHRRTGEVLDAIIEEHRQRQLNGPPENYRHDFLDALLGFVKTADLQEPLSMENIKGLLLNLIAAGGDTSAVTAHWALSFLIKHPHMMRKAREEIALVVGTDRLVQEQDLPQLKYLYAVVQETFRVVSVVPLMLPRESMEDCEIQGFHIPAKTRVIVNAWAIHRDPALWERPLEFDPDRFLKSTIDLKAKDNFNLLPFGGGRRLCVGNSLGILMGTYPLAHMLHALDFTLPDGQKPEDLDMSSQFGVVNFKRLPLIVFAKPRLPNHVIYPDQQA